MSFQHAFQYVTRKTDSIDEAAIGGNASAEGADAGEGVDDEGAVSGLNVVLDNRLVETGFDSKKAYQTYLKVSLFAGEMLLYFKIHCSNFCLFRQNRQRVR